MKRTLFLLAPALLLLAAFTLRPAPVVPEGIDIGDPAPLTDIEMMDVSGEMTSLTEAAGENGLLVLFSCNTCPYVIAWEDRYPGLAAQAEELGLGMIALNANTTQHNGVDSMAEMKKRAEAQGYTFSYAVDENNVLADAFGATRTPEAFLFNSEMLLQYHGAHGHCWWDGRWRAVGKRWRFARMCGWLRPLDPPPRWAWSVFGSLIVR